MPVQIRQATAFMAMYSVPTGVAQALIDGTGLQILQYRPGRGLCVLVFVDYVEGGQGPNQCLLNKSSWRPIMRWFYRGWGVKLK
ncbi:hypothetical protein ACFWPB_21900, partial [Rhodococcus sp. NPDC058514]